MTPRQPLLWRRRGAGTPGDEQADEGVRRAEFAVLVTAARTEGPTSALRRLTSEDRTLSKKLR